MFADILPLIFIALVGALCYQIGFVRGETAEMKRRNDEELNRRMREYEDRRGSFRK